MTKVSIIIPTRKVNCCILKEIIPALDKQRYKNFELIIVCQSAGKIKLPNFVKIIKTKINNPAKMRDIGAGKAKGSFLAFIDDDVYPSKSWLKNALPLFSSTKIVAVCGPGITPPEDNLKQKASGWVWSSWLGAGGAGTYRCFPGEKRYVNDYPTFNLIIRKKDFDRIGGFDTHFWPGEDTKLCHNLVYKLKKKIVYSPEVLVYHHRRPIFIPHLKQISRYGLHRGYFAKILPKTSFRIGYFVPSIFTIFVFLIPLIYFLFKIKFILFFYILVFSFYIFLLFINSIYVFIKEKNILLSFLLIPVIFTTHLVYGFFFVIGLLIFKLSR